MEGLKIVCPNCKRNKDFVTTVTYNPDVTPNGGMVKCLLPYQIDWLCHATTGVALMACPECLGQLAPGGRLVVIPTTVDEIHDPLPVPQDRPQDSMPSEFACNVCGRVCKNKLGLTSHLRTHK